ncbi:MAG: hypothetical protein U1E59_18325 [Amaricoccus sp.]
MRGDDPGVRSRADVLRPGNLLDRADQVRAGGAAGRAVLGPHRRHAAIAVDVLAEELLDLVAAGVGDDCARFAMMSSSVLGGEPPVAPEDA